MEYDGTYIFVLHIKDDHPELYRDHQHRWTLELNAVQKVPGYAVWCTGGPTYNGLDTTNVGQRCAYWLKRAGYKPWPPDGRPQEGGSGTLKGTNARLTIRTLNRLSPTDPPEQRSACTRNAVWVFYGHSGPHDIVFRDLVNHELISNSQQEDPANGVFNILNAGFALDHVRLVFLAGCDNAGYPRASSNKEASIAGSFYNSKSVDAVVGFRGPVYTDSIPYRRFFEIFWKGVCKDHLTVGEAIRRAKRSMRPWLLRIFKVTPSYPEVWGENTRLYPAAYGR